MGYGCFFNFGIYEISTLIQLFIPYYSIKGESELQQTGEGPDTILAHLEQGDVIIPPDLLEDDPEFESYIEQKFNDYNINPEERVAQVGVASLMNPQTGLQQFGFLKKIGKKLKKVIRPIAQIAQFIPGPWQPIAAIANKALTVYDVATGKKSPVKLHSSRKNPDRP